MIQLKILVHLGQEKSTISRFTREMENVQRIGRKKIVWRGLLNSVTQAISFGLTYGFALSYGGYMVAHGEIHYKEVIRYDKLDEHQNIFSHF